MCVCVCVCVCVYIYNAACQLAHAAIRKTAKGGGALYSAPDLKLVMGDISVQPMTTGYSIESLPPPFGGHRSFPNLEDLTTRLVRTPHNDG